MNEKLIKYQQDLENRERLEHRDTLLAIGALIKTKEGQQLFKYLFKNLEVMNLPERSMEGNVLHEYLGFLRAGNSIYKLVCEADHEIGASILAKIERERYELQIEQYRIESGIGDSDDRDGVSGY